MCIKSRIFIRLLLLLCPALAAAQSAADLFDDSILHDVWIDLNPADWRDLREHYMENTYYQAVFRWRGLTFLNAGVRSRGNGSRSPAKPGIRVDFNRYKSGSRFLGLKAIALRNLVQDPTGLHQRLTFSLLARLGIPAPRESFARVFINKEYYGLYTITEEIDSEFLSANFNQHSGPLYEYKWIAPWYFESRGNDPSVYLPLPFRPQENETSADAAPIIQLVRAINSTSDSDFAGAVAAHLDLKQFLALLAAETYLSEADGFLGEVGINNFYLYQYARSPKLQIIPWDRDASFQDPFRDLWHNTARNVLASRALSIPEFRTYYLESIAKCARLAGPAGGYFDEEAHRYFNLARGAIRDDSRKPYIEDEIDDAFAGVFWFIRTRYDFVCEALANEGFSLP
jgi:spore coat protein CotH